MEEKTIRVEIMHGGKFQDFAGFYTTVDKEEFGKSHFKFVPGPLQNFYNKPGNIELYFNDYFIFEYLWDDDIRVLNSILDKDTICGVDGKLCKIEKEIVSIKIGNKNISKYVFKRILMYCILYRDMKRSWLEKFKSLFDIEELIEFFTSDEAINIYIKDKKDYSNDDFNFKEEK